MLFQRGAAAVRHFEWQQDGSWFVTEHPAASWPDGSLVPARLHPATACFGPWVLLAWSTGPGWPRGRSGRRYAFIDAREVGPAAFRLLKGRLALEASRASHRPTDHN